MPTAKGLGPPARSRPRRPASRSMRSRLGLDHPRWINVLPNGDVLIAEATQIAGTPRSVFHYAMQATMRLLQPSASAPTATPSYAIATATAWPRRRGAFMEGLSPAAVRHGADRRHLLEVGNTDGVVAFPLCRGRGSHHRAGTQARQFQARRALDAQPAAEQGRHQALCRCRLRSPTSPEMGMEVEEGRAAIYELDLASGNSRIFASGLRNAVGSWHGSRRPTCSGPSSTSATASATRRRRIELILGARGRLLRLALLLLGQDGGRPRAAGCGHGGEGDPQPDYALGGHTASLGLCNGMPAGTLPGFPDGMVIGQHGSWNRSTLSWLQIGVRAVRERSPRGPGARHPVVGFLAPDEKVFLRPPGWRSARPRRLAAAGWPMTSATVIWRVTGA